MGKYDDQEIEVINWDAFNPRGDSKKPTWFRLDNVLATGPSFHSLSCEQKWLWIVILSLVSQKNGKPIIWNSEYVQSITKISKKKQEQTLDTFVKSSRLRVSRTDSCEARKESHATNERTNITDEHDQTEAPPVTFDFESLYQKYPLKKGKTEGIARCKAQIKTQADFDNLSTAIDRYKRDLTTKGIEPRFIKHFSSFLGANDKQPWRDWLDPAAGKVTFGMAAPISKIASQPETTEAERTDPALVREIISKNFHAIRGAS